MKCFKQLRFLVFFGLFICILGINSISYADNLVPTSRLYMTLDMAEQIIDNIGDYNILSNNFLSSDTDYNQYILTPYVQIWNKLNAQQLANTWNNGTLEYINQIQNEIGEEIDWQDIILVPRVVYGSNNNIYATKITFSFLIANFESSNVLNHVAVYRTLGSGSETYKFVSYDNYTKNYFLQFNADFSGDFSNVTIYSDNMATRYGRTNITPNYEITGNNDSMIYIPGIFGLSTGLQGLYFNDFSITNSDYEYYYLKNHYKAPTPTPSGDSSGDSGSGESGGNTGNVDLSNIENGITDINNNIVNGTNQITEQISGDTTRIVETIQQQNENYWGSSGDLNGENEEEEIEDKINEIMDNVSGEITQTEVIGALEGAENKFKNILEYGKQHPEALDLAFSWEDIKYKNQTLIPAGGINFSQMCRDIPELGQARNYLNIIATFGASIALIKHIWNLLLATLGIDNPYLYEDETGDVYTTETLDEMTGERTYTITQTNGKGSSINRRYRSSPEVKHRPIGFRR